MNKTWTVMKFIDDEDTVEAVPTSWIIGKQCHWPTYTNEKVVTAIRNYEPVNTCWPTHAISLFRNGTFDKVLLPSILGENVPQQEIADTPDIIVDFQCGCCPVHNKFDMGQLSTISEDLKKVISENYKVITRKQNIQSLIYDLVSNVKKISGEIKTMKVGVTDQVSREEYHSIFRSFEKV